jgi:hypothetical protein
MAGFNEKAADGSVDPRCVIALGSVGFDRQQAAVFGKCNRGVFESGVDEKYKVQMN